MTRLAVKYGTLQRRVTIELSLIQPEFCLVVGSFAYKTTFHVQ